MTKAQKNGLTVFLWVLFFAILVLLPSYFVSEILSAQDIVNILIYIAVGGGVLCLLSLLLGINRYLKDKKKFSKVNVKEFMDIADDTYAYARAKREEYQNKTKRMVMYSVLYMLLLGITALVTSISIMALAIIIIESAVTPLLIALSALASLIIFHILYGVFYVGNPKIEGVTISSGLAPQIFAMLKECAAIMKVKGNIRVLPSSDSTLSVSTHRNNIYICLGIPLIAMLNKNELFSILLHEFAHVKHNDTRNGEPYARFHRYLEAVASAVQPFSKAFSMFFYHIGSSFFYNISLYSHVITLESEIAADKAVKDLNFGQDCVTALVKLEAYSRFLAENIFTCKNFYRGEKCENDFYRSQYRYFLRYYEEKKEWLLAISRRLLPIRLPTHPTIPERIKFFGVNDFRVSFEENNELYLKEKEKILNFLDNDVVGLASGGYENTRCTEYTFYSDAAKEFEALSEEAKAGLSSLKLSEYAYAYLRTDENDLSRKLFIDALNKSKNNTLANFYLGRFLLYEQNEEGIEYIKKAISLNTSYAEYGTELIMRYAETMGNAEFRNSLRQWSVEQLQRKIDESVDLFTFKRDDKFSIDDISDDIKKLIIERAKKHSAITELYLAKKMGKSNSVVHVVLIEFAARMPLRGDFTNAYNDMHMLLDNLEQGDYMLFVLNNNRKLINKFRKNRYLLYKGRTSVG